MRRTVISAALLLAALAGTALAQSIDGTISTRYRDRWGSEGYEDEDLYTYLRLRWWNGEAARDFGVGLSLRYDVDLLTRDNEIDDGDDDLRIYYAYVDLNQMEDFDFRIGRQILQEAEGFRITGAQGVWSGDWRRLKVGFLAGQPVSYYDSITSDEWAGGMTWSLRPGPRSFLRGSWVHVEEETTEDDVATVSYRHVSPAGWNGWATLRTLNFDVFNGFLGGNFLIDPVGVRVTATYRRQEDINDSTSRYYSHLATILGPSLPYHRLTLQLNRTFSDAVTVGAGWNRREVLGEAENRTNHEYDRVFADLFLHEDLLGGFTASLNFSQWETDRDQSTSLAGSVSRRFGEHFEVDLGSYYAKYDLETFFDDPSVIPVERFDVRTWYVEGDWRVRDQYRIQLEFERGTEARSDDPFYQLELRLGLDLGFLGRGFSK